MSGSNPLGYQLLLLSRGYHSPGRTPRGQWDTLTDPPGQWIRATSRGEGNRYNRKR